MERKKPVRAEDQLDQSLNSWRPVNSPAGSDKDPNRDQGPDTGQEKYGQSGDGKPGFARNPVGKPDYGPDRGSSGTSHYVGSTAKSDGDRKPSNDFPEEESGVDKPR